MAPIFSSFEPRPNKVFTPRTKKTWNGAISDGVRARSRTSFSEVSARSSSNNPKSRESGATRCSRMASRQRLRKNASSPTSTYAGFSLRDSSSEKKRSAWLKARITDPPPSIRLQNIRHQGMREIPRQPIDRRRIFLKKTGQVAGDFVLLVKKIRRIPEDHLALTVGQRHLHAHRDQSADRAPGCRVINQRTGGR